MARIDYYDVFNEGPAAVVSRPLVGRFIVYGLVDPHSAEVRYIGKSSSGLKRPNSHGLKSLLDSDRTRKANWLRLLVRQGLQYGVAVLEEVTDSQVIDDVERFWIAQGHGLGWRLTNLTKGGDGTLGVVHGPEARAAYAARASAWQKNPEALARMVAGRKQYFKDNPEMLVRQSEWMKKYWENPLFRQANARRLNSPEATTRRIAGIKKYWADPENREAESKRRAEKQNTPESTAKRSKLSKAYFEAHPEFASKFTVSTPETRAAHSTRMKAYYADPENKAFVVKKMKEAFTPERRAAISKQSRAYFANPENRLAATARANERWKDPRQRALMAEKSRAAAERKRSK